CVYAYRDRGRMKYVSRDQARLLLAKILKASAAIRVIDSIKNISLDAMMGSELEKRFIHCLQDNKNFLVSRSYAHQNAGWIINTRTEPAMSWHLKAQVDLGVKEGVGILSRPDYVLYPLMQSEKIKPVAIFLDGFAFHKDSVSDDVQKRQAIKDSGNFWVWTVTWADLQEQGIKHVQNVMGLGHNPDMKQPKFYNPFHDTNFATLEGSFRERNSFALLLDYLSDPGNKTLLWQKMAAAFAWVWLDPKKSQDTGAKQKYAYEMQENASAYRLNALLPDEPFVFGGLLDSCSSSQQFIELAAVVPQQAIKSTTSIEQMRNWLRLHICFDDRYSQDNGYEAGFNGFWWMVNLLQFLPDMTFTSRKAVHLPQKPEAVKMQTSVVVDIQPDESWAEILEFGLLGAEEIALLQSLSLPAPTVGYELQDDDGEIIAEADLAWPLQKQALIIDNQEFTALFASKGWHVAFGPIDENTLQHLSGGDK
ncbi:hypothetical protein JQ163_004679, partial [Salmonella enterica subsp. enterica serovar Heidelberg]|nr:hypothetical protein [Salmonella enterica subsp. enterica serovar Heidelberg]EGH2411433.1 hypothetical protein [Salmonella enterica subsp. enterica serovar Heidelberg]EHD5215881.1 hypothetical protein [Salmonella enterica subsp. enterica serovar Heidelberg]